MIKLKTYLKGRWPVRSLKSKTNAFLDSVSSTNQGFLSSTIFYCLTDDSKCTVEYVLKPTEYLPLFRKGSNNWTLTAQYVNGRHFLTAFELNEGTLIVSIR